MYKRVSNLDWKQREDVRLRVARLRITSKTDHDRAGSVSLSRALSPRPTGAARRFPAISGWLRRLLIAGRRKRN
jgi:hypothetical protein